ncbi:TPM domain-containing protein [Anaeromyxobacter diazotrophicus]|uniref:TPM domain-containing protein n=1 Tax=Anaeromyxobacter diazotrophicus TaxID=2590199 RepID=A0A7I9VG56_9BACT|nr:TPM domain-containing protein [Anaeromyxobacter diazotrophicus]GEJ55325.1 hypothetical protein AMYX_00660 [Anaeromyxobacter diazotrophicus]
MARDVPALTGPVVDEAGLLSAAETRRLEALCRAAWAQAPEHRVQLQYLIVRSLEGEDVEGFAVRAFQAWKLGEQGKDNGVLVLVSREDRRLRIETGYGNEGALTDAQAGRILRGTITPAFQRGAYGQGLLDAGVQILSALGALPQDAARRMAQPSRRQGAGAGVIVALVILFLLARVMFSGFGPRRRGFFGGPWGGGFGGGGWGGGGWGGGGWGGGGGGGGWGGGGGRSGGGGASGGW